MSVINGSNGSKSGSKIILSVVDALMHLSVQAQFTWSGRTSKNCTKRPFNAMNGIHGLIYNVCRLADNRYVKKDFEHDLKYKAIKHAGTRWQV